MIFDCTKPKKIGILLFAAVAFWTQQIGSLAKGESAGGLRWASPSEWTYRGSTRMRVATYTVPLMPGDSENGECVVYFFGPGQGGSVSANLRRWLGQFRAPEGGPADQSARTDKLRVGEIDITRLEVSGTYLFKPTPFTPKATPKPGYRMFAAVAQGPVGPVFFKLTAPDKTAIGAKDAFESMLQSLTR
jgi:hypothetical protein